MSNKNFSCYRLIFSHIWLFDFECFSSVLIIFFDELIYNTDVVFVPVRDGKNYDFFIFLIL